MRLLIIFLFISVHAWAQYKQPHASQILLKLKKLNFLGSVLYVAAHPDDENTRVIAWLANERLATTAYLSLTRGDGGQNLIGPEIRDELGLIRTEELLAARKIDGGEQFFTRANDFGFSKNVNETLSIWGKNEILGDVVRIFRQFQPDVVINRFPPNERAGHGHHTASAVLSLEAFDLSGSGSSYPEQLKLMKPWQPVRIYLNTGRFFNNTVNEQTPGVMVINVGGYNTLLGQSYAEIAAVSRSQHKSQGFGSPGRRGNANEFFELAKGKPAEKDIFDGVNTTWTRVKGGEKVIPLVEKAMRDFNPELPYQIVPHLLSIRKAILQVEEGVWKQRKIKEVNELIRDCIGLFAEVTASRYWISPGDRAELNFEIINRSPARVQLLTLRGQGIRVDTSLNRSLENNEALLFKSRSLVVRTDYSSPYWLREPHEQGLFSVSDVGLIGKPKNDPALQILMVFNVMGEPLELEVPVQFKWTDPVKGEIYRPVEVTPQVFVNLPNGTVVFPSEEARQIHVILKTVSAVNQPGRLRLELPSGWRCEPEEQPFELKAAGEEQVKTFIVYPPSIPSVGTLRAIAQIGNTSNNLSVKTIAYDHIPIQTLMPPAALKVVRIDLKKEGRRIGYIRGAGDDIPAALRNMGYEVWEMRNEEVNKDNLKTLDAVVIGVRAVNTNERIGFLMGELLDYVHNGGTLVMQYNTTADLETDRFSPYPISLSRDRVTEEDAEVRILLPQHPVLNFPNKITTEDFSGWVQERGLYFPGSWDSRFEAPLSMNDKGESPKNGSLLVAAYGKGYFVYTGLSFFRQLPEGVPGAYRLFANLVSLGKPLNSETPLVEPPSVQPNKRKKKTK
ncbi:MAG: PIG-L family deacetylase [Cyclobacteriaceae bacterium]|nr:PIG-L family deacetylase [Cyclobacteriaceae bacterium]